jgi:hypothetical protein
MWTWHLRGQRQGWTHQHGNECLDMDIDMNIDLDTDMETDEPKF